MKKTNNKGFSLVELIVVIAIMAVLMVVVAPQMLKYVDRTRIQKDNQAIAEIGNAAKIAMADEAVYKYVADPAGGNNKVTYSFANGTVSFSATDKLTTALREVLGNSIELSYSTYRAATGPKVIVEITGGQVIVTGEGLLDQDKTAYGDTDTGKITF